MTNRIDAGGYREARETRTQATQFSLPRAKKMKRLWWISVLTLLLLPAGAQLGYAQRAATPVTKSKPEPQSEPAAKPEQEKRLAPDFELADINGEKVKLSQFRGKPVFLSFWAYNCPPCRKEAPNVSQLAEKYKEDGLAVLAINHWNESKSLVERFAKKEKLKHRLLMDGAVVGRRHYQIRSVPVYIWIDENGYIVETQTGSSSTEALEEKTAKLVAGFKKRQAKSDRP